MWMIITLGIVLAIVVVALSTVQTTELSISPTGSGLIKIFVSSRVAIHALLSPENTILL